MSVSLLDVNVLVALFDPAHQNHESAHQWFGRNRRRGWATCPMTLNGCARVLTNPAYPTVKATIGEVVSHLARLCAHKEHQFWPDDIPLVDDTIIRAAAIPNHQAITGVCLLATAVRRRARLVTFDRYIPLRAVKGATAADLIVLS